MNYDIIGDIHGHVDALEGLLRQLGYRLKAGTWVPPEPNRIALFVGDLVDRGPNIPATLGVVRRMVDSGAARMVLGNHEYNLIGYHTLRDTLENHHSGTGREYLRPHTARHLLQCQATLDQFSSSPGLLQEYQDWMMTLPLFLELPELRLVHAAWHPQAVAELRSLCSDEPPTLTQSLLQAAGNIGAPEFYAVEYILKGVELQLPPGTSYLDKEGVRRSRSRAAWWRGPYHRSVPLGTLVFPESVVEDPVVRKVEVPADKLQHIPGYDSAVPVFMGHYWLTGSPQPLTPQVACLDYSIAVGGLLTAYTYRGEAELCSDHFLQVDASGRKQ